MYLHKNMPYLFLSGCDTVTCEFVQHETDYSCDRGIRSVRNKYFVWIPLQWEMHRPL